MKILVKKHREASLVRGLVEYWYKWAFILFKSFSGGVRHNSAYSAQKKHTHTKKNSLPSFFVPYRFSSCHKSRGMWWSWRLLSRPPPFPAALSGSHIYYLPKNLFCYKTFTRRCLHMYRYWECNLTKNPHVRLLVGWSICHKRTESYTYMLLLEHSLIMLSPFLLDLQFG